MSLTGDRVWISDTLSNLYAVLLSDLISGFKLTLKPLMPDKVKQFSSSSTYFLGIGPDVKEQASPSNRSQTKRSI